MLIPVLKPLLAALYVLWSFSWLAVAWNYGCAARASWRAAGGTWRAAPADFFSPFTWALRSAACRLPFVNLFAFCPVPAEVPTRYERGHMLRLAIFMGAVKPVLWGWLVLKYLTHDLSQPEYILSILGLFISVLAALSHLLLVYKSSPRAWTAFVVGSLTWIAVAPVAAVLLGLV